MLLRQRRGTLGGMTLARLSLLFGLAVSSACAPAHFERVVRTAAAKDAACGGEVVVKAVGFGYRVQSCEETTYYRCYFARRSMGLEQCCYRVKDEGSATSLVSTNRAGGEMTCLDVGGE